MMEGFGVLIGLALFAALILLPIWIVSSIVRLRREAENDRRENSHHWQDITARLYVLETRLKEQKDKKRLPSQLTKRPAKPCMKRLPRPRKRELSPP